MTLTARQKACLDAMGITCWVSQAVPVTKGEPASPALPGTIELESPARQAADRQEAAENTSPNWDDLAAQVSTCTRCELHRTRTQAVFGVGNRQADILFIGEAPGADEDRQGEPFVGRAGQLLNEMLRAIGLKRQDVYIANILKCRPPNNRDPKPEEATECSPYLYRQIELIQPKIIVALGRIAAQRLLKTDTALSRLRGRIHEHPETHTSLIVTYHPAYLLRSPLEKRKAWEDLLFVKKSIETNS